MYILVSRWMVYLELGVIITHWPGCDSKLYMSLENELPLPWEEGKSKSNLRESFTEDGM